MEQASSADLMGGRSLLGALLHGLTARLKSVGRSISVRRQSRMLHLCETLSLGEKRFVAVVQVNQEMFLVGGAANSVALLTRLSASPNSGAELDPQTGNA